MALNSKHLKINPTSKVCGPYAVTFLSWMPIFERYIGKSL